MKFSGLTKWFFKICPTCNKKIEKSENWTQVIDSNFAPKGYYHLQCAPKIYNNKDIESKKQTSEENMSEPNNYCDCTCHLPNSDGTERDNLYCLECESKHLA